MKTDLRIAICAPNQSSSSETFIANHVNGLGDEVFFLYGGWMPTGYNGKPIASAVRTPANKPGGFRSWLWPQTEKKFSDGENFALFLQQKKIDVVLCEYGITGVHVGRICKKLNIPFVVHFHGFDAYHDTTLTQYRAAYNEVLNNAEHIIAVSNNMKDQLIKLGLDSYKIHLIHYGVDLKMFGAEDTKKFVPTIVSAGRFVTKKAPHLTLLAFANALGEFPGARLIMVGDGGLGNSPELWFACKQLAKALKIEKNVTFTGAISQAEIASIMKESSVFMQHSVVSESGDSEGTPNTILEASASGLCVIATKHAGIPDVVVHEETGYLVDEFDAQKMSLYLQTALREPEKTVQMGKTGARRIREQFDLQIQLNKLLAVLHKAASKK